MEFKSVSTKMSRHEFILLEDYCSKKGVTASSLIRELLLKEMKLTVPANVAGKNKISYDKGKDNFSWSIELDDGSLIDVLKNVSPDYLEDLNMIVAKAIELRDNSMKRKKKGSVSVPGRLGR